MKLTDAAIVLSSLLIVIVFALTAETDIRWVGHALAGIAGLSFSVVTVLAGAQLAGRIKRAQGINISGLHTKIAIYLATLIVATFIYGLWSRVSHEEPLFWQHSESLTTLHGWFGLTAMIVAIAQVVPRLAIRNRRKTRRLHMILGYALVMLLIIQTVLGIQAAILESAELTAVIPLIP